MGRARINKLEHMEKANHLFESRNRRTIMEQESYIAYGCNNDGSVNAVTFNLPCNYGGTYMNNEVPAPFALTNTYYTDTAGYGNIIIW